MKNLIQVFILCFVVAACKTNNKGDKNIAPSDRDTFNTQNADIVMDSLKLTKEFEKFDEARFGHLIKDGVYRGSLDYDYYVEILRSEKDTYYYLYHENDYFALIRAFYTNGNIKHKGLCFNWFSFKKGVWRFFNEQGEVVNEVDYDAPFEFTFEDLLGFCKKEGITVEKGYIPQSSGYHTSIYREVSDRECWWQIEHLKIVDKSAIAEQICLDGKTGNVISRKEYEYINN